MKWFFVLQLLSLSIQCTSQVSKEGVIQRVLINALQTETFSKEFNVCKASCSQINIFDFGNQIPEFPISLEICSKEVVIYNTTSRDHPAPNSIVIHRLDFSENLVKIFFWRPYSGASVIFTYRLKKNNEIQLMETEIGTF
ncbi:hypothetical protein [Flavilitoribacter nigricans]|uniref:Uncharacterized protein n=1 Tax=Flavilitoribacter nigricans (strain ATCC 23147 / DSM 23189 / NBRC 102662 / NCIMB 1420 / SS-2) TaxID=1122177 RepID=A0A2D0MZC2_FLAN2|nr:hypothetical protein [Flavilitoribacter nigricans]PHN00803.1 hypothetical protein CRP01_40390 [Flavilitoribacter nigricans DSM 23189 = NBRC 102662]